MIPHDVKSGTAMAAPNMTTGSGAYSGSMTYNGNRGRYDRNGRDYDHDRYARGGFGFYGSGRHND